MKKQTQKKRPAKGAKNTDRAAVILSLFREFPNNKFSLKHLASASGGATKEGRRETFEILGRLHDEGIVEECAREKYRLTHKHLPHFEGVADMTATGSIYVRVEGEEKDIFVNQRNTANALFEFLFAGSHQQFGIAQQFECFFIIILPVIEGAGIYTAFYSLGIVFLRGEGIVSL